MKKILPILTMILLFSWSTGLSQNRSIIFIEKPFSELLSMAKNQHKLIFLDAYTTWCGPCKWMAANIFTNDTVADYYNKTFICAHFDMEKGEGTAVAKAFQVRAYPSLLFIDSSGAMVHMRVGVAQKIQDYLDMGNVALTPGEGFNACLKKFQEGNRDPKFMIKFLERLQGAYLPVTEPLNLYFASQKESDLLNRANWDIIYEYTTDMDSKEFGFLLSHQKEYSKLYAKDSVNSKIYNVYLKAISASGRSRTFSEATFNELKQKIRNSGYEKAGMVIFDGEQNIHLMKGEMEKFINNAYTGIDLYYSGDYVKLNEIARAFFQTTSDKKNLEKAAMWAKKSIALKSTSQNNDTYANLMFKLGKKEEAIKFEKRAIEIANKENIPTKDYELSLKKFRE